MTEDYRLPIGAYVRLVRNLESSVEKISDSSEESITIKDTSEKEKEFSQKNSNEQGKEAFDALRNGRISESIDKFNILLEKYPTSSYADNSQFWLGKAYFLNKNVSEAKSAFNKVLEKYPTSQKVPDALLELSKIATDENNFNSAKTYLNRIIVEFPNSKQAESAKNAISTLNSNDNSVENNKNSEVSNNVCYDFWYKRNLIFAKNGYCFESNLGKQAFSNFKCSTRSPVFSSSEKSTINQIKAEENELNCDINTTLAPESFSNERKTVESKLAKNQSDITTSAIGDTAKLIRNLLNLAVDNGGIPHESEIQQIVTQITSLPKSKSGNKKLARSLNDKGHAFLKDENLEDAIEMFAQAHKADPFDIEIANNLGFSNMKADNLDAAEKYLIETLVLSPTRATAWSNLGDVYALKDEENKAIACYANMYRFSKNRANTQKFIKQVNANEDIESLKTAREKAIRLANSWFSF